MFSQAALLRRPFCFILSVGIAAIVARADGLVGGGRLGQPQDCVPDSVRAAVARHIAEYEAKFGRRFGGGIASVPKYAFFPMGGTNNRDIFTGGFVDLDPDTPAFVDWNCTPFTYDGHRGTDCGVRSFGEQDIGVPVFAALDGVVIYAQDGKEDHNVGNPPDDGNYVIIDHGNGRDGWYFHLKKNSVLVGVNEPVIAGQQLGQAASSGYSWGPHLHFESQQNLEIYEPYAGSCRPGESGWEVQEPLNLDMVVSDFAPTEVDLRDVPGLPYEMPRTGQFAVSEQYIRFWLQVRNLPAESDWRVRFIRPDDSIAFDMDPYPFFNDELWREAWFWWEYDVPLSIPDMQQILGTWRIVVDFNGQTVVDAPLAVRAQRTPDFNRSPEPVALQFDPPDPRGGDVLFCRLTTPLVVDDLDYDILRFEYVWEVDGQEIRRNTWASHADALPRDAAAPGALVRCTVTPSDGKAAGTPVSVEVTIRSAHSPGDMNCDGALDGADIDPFFLALGDPAGYATQFPDCDPRLGDMNSDQSFDGADIDAFFECLGGGACP